MTTLAEDYLDGNNGSSEDYRRMLSKGQRIGQAFVNALSEFDYHRLTGSLYDPFYAEGSPFQVQSKVYEAIEFLMDNEYHYVLRPVPGSSYPARTRCGCSKGSDHQAEKLSI